jgi:Caspase domain
MKRSLILLGTAMILLCSSLVAADQSALRRFALLIGSNDGGRERQRLLYAEKDARTLAQVLTEVGGVAAFDISLLSDPDTDELDRAFADLKRRIEIAAQEAGRVEFILYYSGHSDEAGLLLGEEHYRYSDLRSSIDAMKADVHIAILDSCSSGAFTRIKGGTRRSPFLLDESVITSGHAYLTSSSEDEAAQESDVIEGSFFTHYLVSGLRGAADTSQDSKVTLNEAYSYASDETLARTENSQAGPQHPSYDIKLTGSGDLVLTDLRSTDAAVELAPDVAGRFFLRDAEGRLVAEMRKLEGIPMAMALPAGSYSATLQSREQLYGADIILRSGRNAYLRKSDFSFLRQEKTRSRGSGEYPFYQPGLPEDENQGFIGEIRSEVYASRDWSLSVDPDDLRHVNNYFGLITPADMARDTVIHNFGLYLVGIAYRLEGFGLGLANLQVQDQAGFQYGCLFNITGGNTIGFAGSGVFNITGGDISGGSGAGVFTISGGDVSFFQGSGIFNIAEGSLTGLQAAGIFNIAVEGTSGAQTAGIFNVNTADLSGIQAAGILNISRGKTDGVQLAGIVNIAEETHGVQGGLVNIAGEFSGLQLGLINISENMDGLALGLINISGNGLNNPSGWVDQSGFMYLGYQLGAGHTYTVAYGGASLSGGYEEGFVSGLGMGVHIPLGRFYGDIDLSAKMEVPGTEDGERLANFYAYSEKETIFPSLRASFGAELFHRLAVFGGVSLEGKIPGLTNNSATFHSGGSGSVPLGNSGYDLELYPKAFFGIRL